jgi:hypothetical protein
VPQVGNIGDISLILFTVEKYLCDSPSLFIPHFKVIFFN